MGRSTYIYIYEARILIHIIYQRGRGGGLSYIYTLHIIHAQTVSKGIVVVVDVYTPLLISAHPCSIYYAVLCVSPTS